jgi:hypothetical protein
VSAKISPPSTPLWITQENGRAPFFITIRD